MLTMKQSSFFLIIGCLFFFSCQRETIDSFSSGAPSSNDVTISDLGVYIHAVKNIPKTKSDGVIIEPVCDRSDTLLYIINYEKGWEVLTADKRAPRVVAFSESGSFHLNDLKSNPAVEALYDGVMDQIRYLKDNPYLNPENASDDWDDLGFIREHESWVLYDTQITEYDLIQDHLTETRWGQNYPWNIRAPYTDSTHTAQCLTGCGPVAAAQVLYYLHDYCDIPEKAYGDCINNKHILTNHDYIILQPGDVTFPSAIYQSYVWDNMPKTSSESSSYFCSVSTLMVKLGELTNSMYYAGETLTFMDNISYSFINDFGIGHNCTESYGVDDSYNIDDISESIYDNQMPCLLLICRYVANPDGEPTRYGHFVVADACKKVMRRITRKYVWNSLNGPQYQTITTEQLKSTYFGINWGWGNTGISSGGSTIWYNSEGISWIVGTRNYTHVDCVLSDFHPIAYN